MKCLMLTWEEWVKAYPPRVISDPPVSSIASFVDPVEAEKVRDSKETADDMAYEVVQHETTYYVIPVG